MTDTNDGTRQDLERHADSWEAAGAIDPLWAVYSTPQGRDGRWDVEEFFATGRAEADELCRIVADAGLSISGRVLDFGCGVGRLSQALADRAETVTGVDVAAAMIDQAEAFNRRPNVDFVVNRSYSLPFADGSFDTVTSLYVLQHMVPAMALSYLSELLRVLRVGGVLAVQVTSDPEPIDVVPPVGRRARIAVHEAPATMPVAGTGTIRAAVTNAGPSTWPAGHHIKLGNHWRRDGEVTVEDDGRTELPAPLDPGETIELALRVSAPSQPGSYELELDIVQEFVAWWAEDGNPTVRLPVEVGAAEPSRDEAAVAGDSIVKMYAIDRDVVIAAIEAAGGIVAAAVPDRFYHPGWLSHTYVARKAGT